MRKYSNFPTCPKIFKVLKISKFLKYSEFKKLLRFCLKFPKKFYSSNYLDFSKCLGSNFAFLEKLGICRSNSTIEGIHPNNLKNHTRNEKTRY